MNPLNNHWQHVYQTKGPHQVSWTQERPTSSLHLIHLFNLPKDAKIIDIGGGDSNLADNLLADGFTDITVLDISSRALERAQERLGEKAKQIKWIVSDINDFNPTTKYDLWHDRAAFHFLSEEDQIQRYVRLATNHISKYLIMGTFSEDGPKKCSGLDICQYSEEKLEDLWKPYFTKHTCLTEDHKTPFDTIQNFLFCSFKKSKNPLIP